MITIISVIISQLSSSLLNMSIFSYIAALFTCIVSSSPPAPIPEDIELNDIITFSSQYHHPPSHHSRVTPVERSMWEPDSADPIHGVHHVIPSASSAYSHDWFWIVRSEPPYPMSRTYCCLEDVISGVRYDGPIQAHRFYSNGWSIFKLASPYPHERHVLCILTRYIHLSYYDILRCHLHLTPIPAYQYPHYLTKHWTTQHGWAQVEVWRRHPEIVDIRVIEESPEEILSNIDALVESVEESLLEYYGSVDDEPLV